MLGSDTSMNITRRGLTNYGLPRKPHTGVSYLEHRAPPLCSNAEVTGAGAPAEETKSGTLLVSG